MNITFKRLLPTAVAPFQKHKGDAGYDLTVAAVSVDEETGIITYDSGLAMEIPEGYVGLVFPRSSIYKTDLSLINCVGVIDSTYRGSITGKFDSRIEYWDLVKNPNVPNNIENGEFPVYQMEEDIERAIYMKLDIYKVGDRFCQIVVVPIATVNFTEVFDLKESSRGESGYGSTGK